MNPQLLVYPPTMAAARKQSLLGPTRIALGVRTFQGPVGNQSSEDPYSEGAWEAKGCSQSRDCGVKGL